MRRLVLVSILSAAFAFSINATSPCGSCPCRKSSYAGGPLVEKVYDISLPERNSRSMAKSIIVDSPVNVIFTQPKNMKTVSVRAKLPEKMYDMIDISCNSDNEIVITMKERKETYNIDPNTNPEIYIECGTVDNITISSVGNFTVKGTLDNCNPINVNVESVGNFEAEHIICPEININISGVGNIDINSVKTNGNLECSISGTGSFDCRKIDAKKAAKLSVDGTGDMKIDNLMTEFCTAEIDGTGNITVAGKARRVEYSVDGTGSIDARDFVADVADSVTVDGLGSIDCNVGHIKYKNDGDTSKHVKTRKIINFHR